MLKRAREAEKADAKRAEEEVQRKLLIAQRKLNDAPEDSDLRCLCGLHEVLGSPKRTLVVSKLAATEGATCTDLFTLIDQRGRIGEQDARRVPLELVRVIGGEWGTSHRTTARSHHSRRNARRAA